MRCMRRSAILLKVGLVRFVFFQLRNEGIHNSVSTVRSWESRRKKLVRLCAYATFQPKHQSSHHAVTFVFLLVFCTVIVRCTETFWSLCIVEDIMIYSRKVHNNQWLVNVNTIWHYSPAQIHC
jgi:hypothetical protein